MMRKILLLLLMLVTIVTSISAQERTVSGRVYEGKTTGGLPGVSVQVKGTQFRTMTDGKGVFTIKVPAGAATLVFTSIGYTTQELPVTGTAAISVNLTEDSKLLTEVVVTALGYNREKEKLPYSVGVVSGESLTLAKSNDVSTSLAGKVSGIQLQGSPSSSFDNGNVVIRGANSLGTATSTNNPLYIVDGTPTEQNNVIMDNVKSISVLKGAAATALYGQRAANGVIIITSKKGNKGAPTIDLNLSAAIENQALLFPTQEQYAGGYASTVDNAGTSYDAEGFVLFAYKPGIHPASWAGFNGQRMLEYGADESWGPKMNGQSYRPYYSWYGGQDFGQLAPLVSPTNKTSDFWETGINLNNSIGVSGGGDEYTYRLTYANQNRSLITPGAKRDQHQIGLNTAYNISKKVTVSVDLSYTYNKTKGQPGEGYDLTGNSVAMNFNQWWQRQNDIDKLKDYENADGTFQSWNIGNPNSYDPANPTAFLRPAYWDSPYFAVEKNYKTEENNRLVGNLGLNYKINDHLSWQSNARMSYRNTNGDQRYAFGGFNQNKYEIYQSILKEMNYETNFNYKETFGDISLDAVAGGNIRHNLYDQQKMNSNGGLSFPDYFDVGSGSIARPTINRGYYQNTVRSVYGRLSLGYKNFLFMDATLRNDWSSTLPQANNSFAYPSVGGSFVFSELLEKDSFISTIITAGKLRASWAQVGSDLDPFKVNTALVNQPIYGTTPSAEIGDEYRSGNVKPSLTTSWEAGADLKLFNLFTLEFTYYQDDNKDQILSLDLDPTTGFNKYQINAGKIQRKGIELSLGASPFKGAFKWDITTSFGRNRSKVISLSDDLGTYLVGTERANTRLEHRVGEQWGMLVGQMWRRDAAGQVLIDATGLPLIDQNKEGGTVAADFTGGFYNSFSYKKFTLAFSMDFQKGGQFHSRTALHGVGAGQHESTVGVNDKGVDWRMFLSQGGGIRVDGIYGPGVVINGVDVSGQANTTYIAASRYFNSARQGDNLNTNILSATYVKLREVRVGYDLPKTILGKAFKAANIGLTVNNAWLIYSPAARDYGIDPSELEQYWNEGGQLPQTRTFGLNLRLTL